MTEEYKSIADILSENYYRAVKSGKPKLRDEEYGRLLQVYMPLKALQTDINHIRQLSAHSYHGDWSQALSGLKKRFDSEIDKLDNIVMNENKRISDKNSKPKK